MRTLVIASLLASSLVSFVSGAQAQEPPARDLVLEPIGHKDLVADHARHALERGPRVRDPSVVSALRAFAAPSLGPQVKRVVFGYLPYWSYTSGAPYVPLRWDMLTHLAWFAAEMDGTGAITDKHGWGGATTASMVADAHAHGVEVIVTVTNFTQSQIATIVGSAENRQRAIDSCLALMAEHGADGVDVDFEFVPSAAKANFVTFMKALKDAVKAAQPNGKDGHVTLAGPSNDWNGSYDYDQLLEVTDGIMMMAYGYHYGGGNPGPASTLFAGSVWGSNLSIEWSISDYFKYGCVLDTTPTPTWCAQGNVPANRHKIILGLPWYGHAWRVADRTVPGTALASGTTVFYDDSIAQFAANGREWEPVSMSSYYHRTVSGNLQQVWVDDAEAFAARVAYADEMDIGGVGIWALGYEGDGPELWDSIDDVLGVAPSDPEPSPELAPEESPEPSPEAAVESVSEPEPQPEPTVEKTPDADPTTLPTTSGADAGVHALAPQRGVSARTIAADDGCAAGSSTSWLAALLVVAWGARRRVSGRV